MFDHLHFYPILLLCVCVCDDYTAVFFNSCIILLLYTYTFFLDVNDGIARSM